MRKPNSVQHCQFLLLLFVVIIICLYMFDLDVYCICVGICVCVCVYAYVCMWRKEGVSQTLEQRGEKEGENQALFMEGTDRAGVVNVSLFAEIVASIG